MPRQENFPVSQPIFGEPVFNESGNPTADPTAFTVPHPSDTKLYAEIEDLLKKDVVSFGQMAGQPHDLYTLSTAYGARGPQLTQAIAAQGAIVFHAVGDTGASSQKKYPIAISVADALTADALDTNTALRPSFLFHLGDVVYDFGESQYYYDQFYDPYRGYPCPIFAIPGNHDSFIVPNTPPDSYPLSIFSRNFCAAQPVVTQEAGSLHRTAMTQPGVYFALDAPFVRIIALFSNALEDPGVLSSENGKWPIPDFQLDFLTAQLQRVKDENYTGALIVALHHPPFVYAAPDPAGTISSNHASSLQPLAQIDTICTQVGVYPHAFLSGHSHNHQWFTRSLTFNGSAYQVPFIVCGNGGHNVTPIVSAKKGQQAAAPAFGADVTYIDRNPVAAATSLTFDQYDDSAYGYLTLTASATMLTLQYKQVQTEGAPAVFPPVTIHLASHALAR